MKVKYFYYFWEMFKPTKIVFFRSLISQIESNIWLLAVLMHLKDQCETLM